MSDKRNPYTTNEAVGRKARSCFLVLVGFLTICLCGGAPMMGDYIGPPEGAAADSRSKMLRFAAFAVVGLVLIVIGFRGSKSPNKTDETE